MTRLILALAALLSIGPARAEDSRADIVFEQSFSPLPMTAPAVAAMKADIRAGHFAKPWSATVAEITTTADCRVTLKAQSILPMLPPGLALSPADRTLMTAALAALEAHERHQTALWHHFATALQTAGCPPHAAKLQAAWKQKIATRNADTIFGFHPGIALLRPD